MQTVHAGVGSATIRRMIGHATAFIQDPTVTAQGELIIALGIAVVTQDGLAAGAVPDPFSDFNQDWYYWTMRTLQILSTTPSVVQVDWDFDIRSMRRLRGGYALAMMTESELDLNDFQVNISLRNLWSQEP